ncbi:PepSY-associated TM helix domain-containing protein [Sphingomonas sp. GCM10030256]|uniref:PepSY-associated TM helix domain-containing protein n=1 Tax=Sphingomonas sp. GCM10030256 TaxID=3273427 RepID=UPI00360C22DF
MIEERPPQRAKRRWRPLLRSCHAWSGLVLSLLLAAMATSGTVLLFKDDFRRLALGATTAHPTGDSQRLGGIANAAKARFGDDLRSIRFASTDLPVHEAVLANGGAYLDADGRAVRIWTGKRPLDLLVEFHHNLFLAEAGRAALGVVATFLTVMIVSGLILWWPVRRTWRARAWPRSARRKEMIAVHRDVGVLITPILLITALTGIVISWPALIQPLFDFSRKPGVIDTRSAGSVDWRGPLQSASAAVPGAAIRSLNFGTGNKPKLLRLRHPEEWNSQGLSFVWFDGVGKIAKITDTHSERRSAHAYGMIFPIHSGQTPQPLFRILLAISGIGLLLISLFGATAFARKLSAKGHLGLQSGRSPCDHPETRSPSSVSLRQTERS